MSDYISRADAIDACCRGWNNTAEDCIRNIKELPSADAEFADMPDIPRYYYEKVVGNMAHEINMLKEQLESAEWIPITEREPDTADHVLVTIKWGPDDFEVSELDYGVAKFEIQHTDNSYFKDIMNNIVAWRYMPGAYRGGK